MSATTAVKELPIPFKGPMVTAIREGRKSMTRRVMRQQPERHGDRMRWCPPGAKYDAKLDMWLPSCEWDASRPVMETGAALIVEHCPHGKPGDRLWVRETLVESRGIALYAADREPVAGPDGDVMPWRWQRSVLPSIHMPRTACRILLEITDVRVERLNAISEADAYAEGVNEYRAGLDGRRFDNFERASCWFTKRIDPQARWESNRGRFAALWETINGNGSWETNPLVWVVGFRGLGGLA